MDSNTHQSVNDLPLKLLEIVLTAFLINVFLIMIFKIEEAGLDAVVFPFNCAPIYIPLAYSAWIYIEAYINKERLSDTKMQKTLYLTSLFALLASIAQISELIPLIEMGLPLWDFINRYMETTALHPLFCAIIVALLIYTRNYILGEKKRVWFFAHVILFIALLVPVVQNITDVILQLARMIGLWRNGYNWLVLVVVAWLVSGFLSENLPKFLRYLGNEVKGFLNRIREKYV